ncbi:MAG: hypothetical protein Q9213_004223 [Squamulea squamosa]
MTTTPATPSYSPRNRRPRWEVDRLSPRYQVFKTKIASPGSSGRFTRWMEEIETFFNPGLFPSGNQASGSSTASDSSKPPRKSGTIRRAVDHLTTTASPESYQAQLEAFRRERRKGSQIDSYQALTEDRLPKIGEDDMECVGQDSPAKSTRTKKRSAAEASDESLPLDPAENDEMTHQPMKRLRFNSCGSPSAKSSISNFSSSSDSPSASSSARSSISGSRASSSSFPSACSAKSSGSCFSLASNSFSILKPLPTPRELERMESKQRRYSLRRRRVINPGQVMDGIPTSVWHTWLAGSPPTRPTHKMDSTVEDLKGHKLEKLVYRGPRS